MATDSTILLKVGTEDAVKSVKDLKDNIKILKDNLAEAEIGTLDYQDTLNELKLNQNALKDAMYATSASLEDVSASASGASESYNGLVHRMAALKEELRATDVSTKEGADRFRQLATQVNEVNDRLKQMDAMQGNFQRNVGNYESHWKGLAKSTDALKKGLESTTKGIDGVKGGFEALSANPSVAIIGLLVGVAVKLSKSLGENKDMTNALSKAMDSLKPIMSFLQGVMERVVDVLVDIIGKVTGFLGSSGIIQKVIDGMVGVGNAIVQFVISPFKAVIAAIKVFQEEGIKGFRNAGKAFAEEMKGGVAFKSNYEAGQAVAESLISGAKSKRKEVKATGTELGKELADGVAEGFTMADFEKALAMAEKLAEEKRKRMAEMQKLYDEIRIDGEDDVLEELQDMLDKELEAQLAMQKASLESAEQTAKARVALLYGVANSTASILGTMADLYEADEANAEKNAEKVKALRIAESTISTITGAIGAYMQASTSYPPPYGQILGATQAAVVTATGMAQIAKIRSQRIGGAMASANLATSISSASVTPTQIQASMPETRNITSASEEERLNQMANGQRVYILQSDIEASGNASKARVAEASF